MNTKALMIATSVCLGAAGIAASFAPAELLGALGVPSPVQLVVFVQLLGALYLAFAMTNWTAKGNLIGGIYSRPLSLGNFLHFAMGALALAKAQLAEAASPLLVTLLVFYTTFALAFGYLVFGRGAACVVGAPRREGG